MAEGEQWLYVLGVVVSVVNEKTFCVVNICEVGRGGRSVLHVDHVGDVVFWALVDGEGQPTGGVDFAEEDVCEPVPRFLSRHHGENDGFDVGVGNPRHVDSARSVDNDDGVGVVVSDGFDLMIRDYSMSVNMLLFQKSDG